MFFKLFDKLIPAMTGTFSGQLRISPPPAPCLWPSAGIGSGFLFSAEPQEALCFSAKDAQALGLSPDKSTTSASLGVTGLLSLKLSVGVFLLSLLIHSLPFSLPLS